MRLAFFFTLLIGCSSAEETPGTTTDATAEVVEDVAVVDTATGVDTATAVDVPPMCKLLKPFSSKNVACNECAQRECCTQINACLADKRCDDDYVNCSLACALLPADAGDAGAEKARCLNECDSMHPEGKKLYDAAFGCTDTKCMDACG